MPTNHRPDYAGPPADPDAVFNDQSLVDCVGQQIVYASARNEMAQRLQAWSAIQRVSCSDFVYQCACSAFCIDDIEKRDYLVECLSCYLDGGLLSPPFGAVASAGPWKRAFYAICNICGADRGGYLVSDWQQEPRDFVQLYITSRLAFLPYGRVTGDRVRGMQFVAKATLGTDREAIFAAEMANLKLLGRLVCERRDDAFIEMMTTHKYDPDIWVHSGADDMPRREWHRFWDFKRLDAHIVSFQHVDGNPTMHGPEDQLIVWLRDHPSWSMATVGVTQITALGMAALQLGRNSCIYNFRALLSHDHAFVFDCAAGQNTLLHLLFVPHIRTQGNNTEREVLEWWRRFKGVEAIREKADLRHPAMFRRMLLQRNSSNHRAFDMFVRTWETWAATLLTRGLRVRRGPTVALYDDIARLIGGATSGVAAPFAPSSAAYFAAAFAG